MSNPHPYRGPALALLAAVCACGPDWHAGGDVDPYNGVIDNSFGAPTFTGTNTAAQGALAAQFQPFVPSSNANRVQCNGSASCYIPTQGYAAGKPVKFFIAGRMASSSPPFQPASCGPSGLGCAYAPALASHFTDGGGGWHADVFPHSCTAMPYDPVQDAFMRDQQWPVADSLPLNNATLTSPHPPLGVVSVYSVSGVSGETCNDLKYSESITGRKFGAQRSANPTGFEVWMVFDPTVPVLTAQGASGAPAGSINTNSYWYRGLQAAYLSGGSVPVDASGNLIAMDGVILDPSSSSSFEVPSTNNAVILPAQPGDDGFSPIVRLHDFRLASGSVSSSPFKGVCLLGDAACEATHGPKGKNDFVLLSSLSSSALSSAFNVVFLAVSAQ